ncbi:MAG: serine hydrolase [Cyanobacteria bacterium J06649_4]
MTDANGTRNSRNSRIGGSPSSQGINTPSANTPSVSTPSENGAFAGRSPLPRPTSKFLPTQRPTQNGASGAAGSSDTPKIGQNRQPGQRPSRRTRRPKSSHNASEKRRIFGSGPDRIKSKSASRTRALKARATSESTARPQSRILSQSSSQAVSQPVSRSAAGSSKVSSIGRQTSATATLAGKPTVGKTATGKQRSTLVKPSSSGRVPPARGAVRRRRKNSQAQKGLRRLFSLLVFGVGIAIIGGTLLQSLSGNEAATTETVEPETVAVPEPVAKKFPVPLNQEIPALKAELQELPNLYPGLTANIFYADVDTGRYISIDGSQSIAAASTIKLPILLAFFEEVDAGRIDPNQSMQIQPSQIAEGSGDFQVAEPGTQFTALEVASQMIINSDNTATNMMIDLLGGQDILNLRFKDYGLESTQLSNPLPDLEGTNTTSARDLAHTMLLISEESDLSVRSRDRVLNILNRTYNKSLLAGGLEEQGALTFNKTGDIASVLGDIALVDMPNGKRYVISALVKRPDNDGRAREMLRRISGRTYQEADKEIKPSVTPVGNGEEAAEGESPAEGSAPETTQPDRPNPESTSNSDS